MVRQLEKSIMDYEKRVLDGFQMQEENFITRLYNLIEKRDNQDSKIAEIKLINENLCEKIQESCDRLEKINI